jgi:hypothetical protein
MTWESLPAFADAATGWYPESVVVSPDGTAVVTATEYSATGSAIGGGAWRSTDGLTWDGGKVRGDRWIAQSASGPAGFVAAGGLGLWSSADGTDWEARSRPKKEGALIRDVVGTSDGYVAFGATSKRNKKKGTYTYTPAVWRSTDGAAWELEAVDVDFQNGLGSATRAPDGTLYASEFFGKGIARQTPAGAWETVAPVPSRSGIRELGHAAGRLYAISMADEDGSELWVSEDGTAWDPGPPIGTTAAIAPFDEGVIILGPAAMDGPMLARSSSDWTEWTEAPAGIDGEALAAAAQLPDGRLLVVGSPVAFFTEATVAGWIGTPV